MIAVVGKIYFGHVPNILWHVLRKIPDIDCSWQVLYDTYHFHAYYYFSWKEFVVAN